MSAKTAVSDRRVVRTRQTLRDALIGLILEKGYDAITVHDIVQRANIARSTFYAHHGSKESVLLDGVGALRDFLAQAQRDQRSAAAPLAFIRAFFEHADGHRDLYRALMGDGGGAVVNRALRQMFVRLIRPVLVEAAGARKRPIALPVEAVTGFATEGLMAVVTWWLEAKPRLPPAEGERIYLQLIEPALAKNGFAPPPAGV
ncbi:MAG: TetR/AcrR family transcriptional regulator [Opitutae bacterium]|nr:TetR/AcrR family transcriptional regulator [Opitutae bacterium]